MHVFGEVADSDEHAIPRWLQRRFNLSNQEVILPNQTVFRYAKGREPVATEHNREFGKIEHRMAEKHYSAGSIPMGTKDSHRNDVARFAFEAWAKRPGSRNNFERPGFL